MWHWPPGWRHSSAREPWRKARSGWRRCSLRAGWSSSWGREILCCTRCSWPPDRTGWSWPWRPPRAWNLRSHRSWSATGNSWSRGGPRESASAHTPSTWSWSPPETLSKSGRTAALIRRAPPSGELVAASFGPESKARSDEVSDSEGALFSLASFFLVKTSSTWVRTSCEMSLCHKSLNLCRTTSEMVVPPLLNFCRGVMMLSMRPALPPRSMPLSLRLDKRVRWYWAGSWSMPTTEKSLKRHYWRQDNSPWLRDMLWSLAFLNLSQESSFSVSSDTLSTWPSLTLK